jgi:uncharacterized protein
MHASMSAQRAPLSDGRWHFQHGPIDIVIGAHGEPAALKQAHQAAWQRFETVLQELVSELPMLRRAISSDDTDPRADEVLKGAVARRMWNACAPYRADFITPMAAVAGSVAQELITSYARPGVDRAWVNNGGDIALHLMPRQSVRVGLFADLAHWQAALNDVDRDRQDAQGLATDEQCEISFDMPVRGIATSGWRGRSFSLGIADSVTVLAQTAAMADAAATVIANVVNVVHPGIVRRPACDIRDDSDLGAMRVTVDVPRLSSDHVRQALAAGQHKAESLAARGLIESAVLVCQGQFTQATRRDRVDRNIFQYSLSS